MLVFQSIQFIYNIQAYSPAFRTYIAEERHRRERRVVSRISKERKMATTTPLVKKIFEDFFSAQIEGGKVLKKRRR
jgi:hypothetical protein